MRRSHENILLHLILDRSPHPNVDPYQLRLNSWLTENPRSFLEMWKLLAHGSKLRRVLSLNTGIEVNSGRCLLILDRDVCPNKSPAIRFCLQLIIWNQSFQELANNQHTSLTCLFFLFFYLSRSPLELDNIGALVCIYLQLSYHNMWEIWQSLGDLQRVMVQPW